MRKKETDKPRRANNILILLSSSTTSSTRDFLSGFALRARARRNWQLHLRLSKRALEPNILRAIQLGGYDGIVTNEDMLDALPKGTIPPTTSVIVFGTYDPAAPKNVAFVQNNNGAIAKCGANYLLNLGRFRSFGFVPTEAEHGWSRTRAQAFADEIARHHTTATIFVHGTKGPSLKAWLNGLPKPAAIMAACDTTALEIVETCKRAKISIPEQVSVLGVDNDELMCEFASPTISSVLPRHDKVGELADIALGRMFRGWPDGRPRREICEEQAVIERESTAPIAPASHLITTALGFIRHNATKDITVGDVVTHLGVSRSLADLRFREYQGETISEVILRMRLEEVKKRLARTNMSVTKVARVCGFSDVSHLQVVFKKRFGLPMGQWRQQHFALNQDTDMPVPRTKRRSR